MTFEHVIFIPSILFAGVALGYAWGAGAVRAELAKKQAKLKE